jgi:hypothetical protein
VLVANLGCRMFAVANLNENHSGEPVFNCFPELTAGDVDEAADVVTRVFLPATVNAIGMTRLDLRMNVVQLPALTAGQLRFGADVGMHFDEGHAVRPGLVG